MEYFCGCIEDSDGRVRVIFSTDDARIVAESLREVRPGDNVVWHKTREDYRAYFNDKVARKLLF